MPLRKPLNVAYIVKRYPRYSETFIVNEILAHEQAGLDIGIFSLRPPNDTHFQDTISLARAPVTYLPSSGVKAADFWQALSEAAGVFPNLWNDLEAVAGQEYRDVYQAVLLARQVRLKGITHLHAHFANSPATVARLAARFAGISYTFTAHAKDIYHEDVQAQGLLRKLGDAASVITVSDFNLRYLRDCFGHAASSVVRVYNGLWLDRFPYRSPHERRSRVVAVGRLVAKKGFSHLVDACATLLGRGHQFDCWIIGTGELEADLRTQIDARGLGATVRLVGPRPQAQIAEIVRDAAVFAAPCVVAEDGNRDGLPTVLLEAMALGTPCVSTDVTGIPEVIRNGQTGVLVPQHDSHTLAKAIGRLLADGDLRVRLARRARQLIEAEFDVRQNAARMRSIFDQAVGSDRIPLREVCA